VSSGDGAARRVTRFALLVATAVVLHMVEGMFPPPLPLPGAKLGLANIVGLVSLVALGWRAALSLVLIRTVLGSLIGGGLLGFGFILSFGAGMAATSAMALCRWAGRERFSLLGVSLLGALTHNLAQLALAAAIVRHTGLLTYLPYMLLGSLPTGAVTGLAAHAALAARNHALGRWLGAAAGGR
jgi:heptaprenyl diphosphate synthase